MENFKKFKFKSNPSCRCHCCNPCCRCRCQPPFIPEPPTPVCHFLVHVTDAGQLATPDNMVSVIDTATNTVFTTIPVGLKPVGTAITPDGTLVYIVNKGSNTVSVISTATNTVIDTIPGFNGPTGIKTGTICQ
ncbi:YncE family protein [Viridibacillus sp. NPDC096237]|uniref:YncE family protein n=1 Tax=Viridibacillus sp. NPDC096237 TaxID=3390721 RepID=UPI003D02C7A4